MSDEQEYVAHSVLVVVAHPDDAEFMAAGTIGKWAQEGKEINYVLFTAGDKGSSDRSMPRSKPDVVLCWDPTARWTGQNRLNHPDHRASGDAALDAVFPSARDALVFPE